MKIKSATFITSAANLPQILDYGMPEIAIAGKSNVGKSSFINFLANNKRLAKTSGTPGRTRLLNYFSVNNGEFMLVDLPGYGYAKAAGDEKEKWAKLIDDYFVTSSRIVNVFILLDIRHEPGTRDKMLINYLNYHHLPFTVIATKCDKLSRPRLAAARLVLANAVAVGEKNVILTSAFSGTGRDDIEQRLEIILKSSDNIN